MLGGTWPALWCMPHTAAAAAGSPAACSACRHAAAFTYVYASDAPAVHKPVEQACSVPAYHCIQNRPLMQCVSTAWLGPCCLVAFHASGWKTDHIWTNHAGCKQHLTCMVSKGVGCCYTIALHPDTAQYIIHMVRLEIPWNMRWSRCAATFTCTKGTVMCAWYIDSSLYVR